MEIAAWLRDLGLGQYEQIFRDNAVDAEILPELTDEHLKELGLPLGHRLKLLKAIGALRAGATSTSAAGGVVPATASAALPVAERRQLTVMFVDLVGSTELAGRLDPEDYREILGSYHQACAASISALEGFVAKYMGDGVLAYFGYPLASEHDAEHAVAAGLAVVDAVPKLRTRAGSPLQVRIGIATGLVVVGDLTGSGEAQERGIAGGTPNLAARLQGIAEPNTVVIAETTRRLVGNRFELKDLGAKDLKGIAGSTRAWAALRASSVESRFEALHAAAAYFVGRGSEAEWLLRRWAAARTGEGQVALISGEAGIGKSRLTAALLQQLAAEPHVGLRFFCSPQHTDSALYPIIGQVEHAAGMARDDTAQVRLDKLDALLAPILTSPEDAGLIADMLSLPDDGRYPRLELTPQQRRQRTLEATAALVEAQTRSGPLLMVFEDAHWADPTSLEAIGLAVDRIWTLPVLLIVTFRPGFAPPWIGRPHVGALTLDRLAPPEIAALVDRIAGDRPLPEAVRREIIERTDGIPLFVEEMTKAVLESQGERNAAGNAAGIRSSALAVPASLSASLLARLDRLGPAKEVAQVGAVIGREFSHDLLAAVVGRPEAELRSALDRLVGAGLLFRQGLPPQAHYLFKHALVQDAAYGTLLRETRRTLHARIVSALEGQFASLVESRPELLARHCTEAGLTEKAAALWAKAGRRSLSRSALREAAEQLERALHHMADLPGTPVLRREQIRLQLELAHALMHTKGHAAPETTAAFAEARAMIERAEALGEASEDPLVLFSVLYGFWLVSRIAFSGTAMLELAAQFLALAEDQKATGPLVVGHHLMGLSLVLTGGISAGRVHLDRAIPLYDPAQHRALATRFGHDVRMSALSWRAVALWLLGHPEAALADAEQVLTDGREIGHAATLMYALSHASLTLLHCGRHAAASGLIDELASLADQKSAPFWKAYAILLRGWFLALAGNAAEAVETISTGIAAMRSTGATAYAPWYLTGLARAQAELGDIGAAQRSLEEAAAAVGSSGERWYEAEVHRQAGEVALLSDAARGEARLQFALTVARQQHAKAWELRAATSLARLWRDQGRRSEARAVLAPVLDWFTEGFDTTDLTGARALLQTLG